MDYEGFAPHRFANRNVVAVVEEVLPALGLAYAVDDNQCRWAVTQSTPGSGLQSLVAGHRVSLTISRHAHFEVASGYAPLL